MHIYQLVAGITRYIRFPGRERFLRAAFPPERFRRGGKTPDRIIAYDGDLLIHCDLGSFIEWQIYFKGFYAPDLSRVLKSLTAPGMLVIDVGANIGAYSLLMARNVGRGGRVYAFEPNPEVRERLTANLELNGFGDIVRVYPLALAIEDGELPLFVPQQDYPHRGIASLRRYVDVLKDEVRVQVTSLDKIASKEVFSRCDLIKIDTEGSDHYVISGAMETIERFRPVVVFEFMRESWLDPDVSLERVIGGFRQLGYTFARIGFGGRLIPLAAEFPNTNVVCIPAGRKI